MNGNIENNSNASAFGKGIAVLSFIACFFSLH